MAITDEQVEKAARAMQPYAFRELTLEDRMSDDYAMTNQREAQERARKAARKMLEDVAWTPEVDEVGVPY